MNAPNHHWIKKVQSIAMQAQEVPMWGTVPPFPWDQFASELSTALSLKDLRITPKTIEWKPAKALLAGMGDSPFHSGIELSPLEGEAFLIFASEDFTKLTHWSFASQTTPTHLSDPNLQQGFFRYLTLEGLHIIDKLSSFADLTPKLTTKPLPKEESYCIDFSVQYQEETVWGRLICPPSFQEAFKTHFSQKECLSIPSNVHRDLLLNLNLHAGSTKIAQKTWKEIEIGDFILLDQCSYSPLTKKGTFQLCLNNAPLFQVKLKEEQIKILDYALYYEDIKMEDLPDHEELEDNSSEHPNPEDMSEDMLEDVTDSMEEEEETHLEDEDEEEELEPEITENAPKEPLISPDQVPLLLSVEMGRLKMSLDKLLSLKPGNVLKLKLQSEREVNLTANGQCVARGQLIQLGDVIGVKITEMGS